MTLPLSYSRLRASQLPLPRRFGAASPLGALETCVRRGVLPSIITAEAGSPNRTRGIPLACQAETRLRYRVSAGSPSRSRARGNFGAAKAGGEGRTRTFEAARATDLQSAAFDRFATSPAVCVLWKRDVFLNAFSSMELAKGFEPPTC